MNVPAGPHLAANPSGLAPLCLAHVEQEEMFLAELLTALRQVRSALVQGEMRALGEAMELQSRLAERAGQMRSLREQLRRQIAATLGVPPAAATLQLVASRLPPEPAAGVSRGRQRLARLAAEVADLHRANAALFCHALEFFNRFLAEITGGEAHGATYTADGTPRPAACGSLIQARG